MTDLIWDLRSFRTDEFCLFNLSVASYHICRVSLESLFLQKYNQSLTRLSHQRMKVWFYYDARDVQGMDKPFLVPHSSSNSCLPLAAANCPINLIELHILS